jgi:histidine phosphotransferase ChpT
VAKGFFGDDKTQITWTAPRMLLPKNRVKLLLNLVVIAAQAIPRGGMITLTVEGDAKASRFVLSAKGINARIPPHAEALLAGAPESGAVDAHGIQAYYAGMVARAAGMKTAFAIEGDTVTITAEMDPENPNSAPIDTGMIG